MMVGFMLVRSLYASAMNDARWSLHRLALAPLLPGGDATTVHQAISGINQAGRFLSGIPPQQPREWRAGEPQLLSFLEQQGLAAFWHRMLDEGKLHTRVSANFFQALHAHRVKMAANYRLQKYHIQKLRQLFDGAGIEHLLFKGGHVRERIHDEPALRGACDLDVLVARRERRRTVDLLRDEGYELIASPENVSHEVSLIGQGAVIDLHWDLLRPGRTRVPLAVSFLASRKDFGTHLGPDDSASLFLMLVHPVFTKYTTTPQSTLVRVLDLFWWLERVAVDWSSILEWLNQAGLRTAAWTTLRWLRLFGRPGVPYDISAQLYPGRVRSAWLNWWVKGDLSTRWANYPRIVQGAFTLPVHDRMADALRALRMRRKARQQAVREMEILLAAGED